MSPLLPYYRRVFDYVSCIYSQQGMFSDIHTVHVHVHTSNNRVSCNAKYLSTLYIHVHVRM